MPSLADVRARMRADRYAARAGIRLVAVRPGYARAVMRLSPEHLNGVGIAQGGALFTLADLAFAAAANSHGEVAVALDVSITFLRGLARGTLTAEAREVSRSRRVSVCEVTVTGRGGVVVALFRGTAYRKGEEPPAAPPARPKRARRGASRDKAPRG